MRKILRGILWTLLGILAISFIFMYKSDLPVQELQQRYTNNASRFMELNGMKVHYRDEGPATDSIPLVLIHGTSSFLQTWDGSAKEWIANRRVIRMDLPGFAITGPSPDKDYSMDGYTRFLDSFLNRLKVQRCYLAGNSLGGEIAFSYAYARPDRVSKLILLDAAGYPIVNAKGALAFKMAQIPVLNNLLTVITPRFVVKKSLYDVYGDPSKVTDSLVNIYWDMTLREGNRRALLERFGTRRKVDTSIVKNIGQPTLVIWGDRDQLIPVDNAYKFKRDLPNATLVIMKGIGHVPMEEVPSDVVRAVNAFLAQ